MRILMLVIFLLFSAPSWAQEAVLESSGDSGAFRIEPGSHADGERLYTGRVGQNTPVRALRVKAKEGNNRDAQFDLCAFYAEQQDFKESFKWCQTAADRGDVEAQVKMGDIYTQGLGVTASPQEAFNWYLFAADNGNEAAQLMVAAAYSNGEGVAQNDAEAWFWLSVTAGANESPEAKQHRDELAAKLDPAMLEKQRQRLDTFKKKR